MSNTIQARDENNQIRESTKRRRMGRRDFGSIKKDGTATAPSFSVRWFEGPNQKRKRGFATRGEAAEFLSRKRIALADDPNDVTMAPAKVSMGAAIDAYSAHLREKGNKPGPIGDTVYRLRTFFPDPAAQLADLTPSECARLYDVLRTRITRTGKPYSVDSHRNMLAEAKSLLKWCVVTQRWIPRNPLESVEGKGRRKHGKIQLRFDEARRWLVVATSAANNGDTGAIAAMMTLLLGMRASEIVNRVVRDLDDDGGLLWIPTSKTEAGRRTLRVPEPLRTYLRSLVQGRRPEERIFGDHWRDWPRESVQRLCRTAGLPLVSAHSMRGLHATLAMEAGITGAVVAASLGHESATTTTTSYAKPEASETARQHRALRVLDGGRAG